MPLNWPELRVRLNRGSGRVRCEPGWRLDSGWAQRLSDCDLWLVWAGRGVMRTHRQALSLRPGMCLWMRPGGHYEAVQDVRQRLGVTFIHFDLLDQNGQAIHDERRLPAEVHEVPDPALADALTRRVVELVRHGEGDAGRAVETAAQLLRALLMDLDADAASAGLPQAQGISREQHRLITQLAARITESPTDVLSISEMAEEAGYSSGHFAQLFRRVLGQSPQGFVVQARINRACQLLVESDRSISQIADALGYESLYFFSRQFHRKTGQTPSQFRRAARTPATLAKQLQ